TIIERTRVERGSFRKEHPAFNIRVAQLPQKHASANVLSGICPLLAHAVRRSRSPQSSLNACKRMSSSHRSAPAGLAVLLLYQVLSCASTVTSIARVPDDAILVRRRRRRV